MTKKFWTDWQNRIGETKNIYLEICVFNKNNGEYYYHNVLSKLHDKDKILKAEFHGNTVDLIIERHKWVFGKNCNDHWNIENEYLTLHRTEIKTIQFRNLWK